MDEWTDEWVMKKDFWRSVLKEKLSTFKIPHFFSFFFSSEAHAAKFLLPTVGAGWWGGWRWRWRWGLTCPMVISRPSSSMTVFCFFCFFICPSEFMSLETEKRRRRRRRSVGGGGAVTLWPSLHAAASPESSTARPPLRPDGYHTGATSAPQQLALLDWT